MAAPNRVLPRIHDFLAGKPVLEGVPELGESDPGTRHLLLIFAREPNGAARLRLAAAASGAVAPSLLKWDVFKTGGLDPQRSPQRLVHFAHVVEGQLAQLLP